MTKSLREEIEKSLLKLSKDIANQPFENLIEPLEDAYEKLLLADYMEKRNDRRNALQKRVITSIEATVAQIKTPIATPKVVENPPPEEKYTSSMTPEIKVLATPEGPPPMPNQEPEMEPEPVTEVEKPIARAPEKPAPPATKAPAPEVVAAVKTPSPVAAKPTPKTTTSIAEKAQAGNQQRSLNDRLTGQKLSFGLNDRLAYVKHLFEGNTDDFNRVISQLNTMEDWDEAGNFINEMVKPDFNWAGKEDYEERFLNHIRTKFD